MRYTRILITIVLLQLSTVAFAQQITLSSKNITLDRLFAEIKKQTGYDFLYNTRILEKAKPVNVDVVNVPLRTVLDNCFAGQPLTYTIDQRTIIVKEKQTSRGVNSTISGTVVDKNGKPVANASVFLSNATIGSQSDTSGSFRLTNVKPGKYDLVVSMIGFEIHHQSITISGDDISVPGIELAVKMIGLQEVVIKAHTYKPNAIDLYNFKRQFLGSTYLANQCEIRNPRALNFDYDFDTHTLRVSSDNQFIIIDNNALGYRMRYLLEDFTYNQSIVKYNGSVLFEPMHGSPSQENRWAKKREQVYASSEMHFLRLLLTRKVDSAGFRILPYLEDTTTHKKVLSRIPMPCTALLHPTDQDGLFAFGTKYKALYVEYNPKHRFRENDLQSNLQDRANFESSVISFSSPYLYFDQNGWVTNANDVSLLGAWENCRVAGLLPSDYEPAQAAAQPGVAVVPDTSGLGRQLKGLKETSDTLNAKYAAEKLYIQFDKPYYAAGDTIWLKAYLLNEPTYNLSARSGLLHIDLANDSNKVIKQYILPLKDGLAWGKISLDDKNVKPGNYVLRAYTQWMRNFGSDAFYYKNIIITGADNWLVNENIGKGKGGVDARLQFTGLDKTPVANKVLQLQVKADSKRVYAQNMTTDAAGRLNTSFSLPEKASGVSLIAEDKAGGRKAIIPVSIDREMNIDLQLLPEGGQLAAGFNSRVGFKAVTSDGKGIAVSGIITDQNQKQVAAFKSLHNGMGSFELLPEKGAIYTAKLTLPDGSVKSHPLPGVKASGTVLQVKNLSGDSLQVNIAATDSLVRAGNSYFLLAKARGVICYG
ncbi:MAG: carboxypeptidase-like regulatory domain-containing protein, partial [Mucilaginibacter sp.]